MTGTFKNKKTLILINSLFEIGGIQQYNRYLCDALETEFDKSIFIAVSLNDTPNREYKNWRNIHVGFSYPVKSRFIRKVFFLSRVMFTFFVNKPDFLICAHANLSPIGFWFKKLFGLKYAILTHGIDIWSLRNGIKYTALKNADVITAVSSYTKHRMVANGIPPEKIKLLQNTVDTSLFCKKSMDRELINRNGLKNKRILLTVGRMSSCERYKGHGAVLEALQLLGSEYVWLVIGGGDDLSYLRETAARMDLIDRVKFLGEPERDKLIDYFNLCDCFIMPSNGEGFGIVFLEAMACGKPVIGGNKDGSQEPLMDGKLGFTVDPDNIHEIAHAVQLACTTREKRTDPEYLIRQTRMHFGIEIFRKKVKTIFNNILE